ncbi:MAG: aminomethyl-transferring glycine dehydrogenase [Bacteroidales bacterium]|nr:aminomethyl-transferring glycine dehydrogenase [Bacteroidales bacterium]
MNNDHFAFRHTGPRQEEIAAMLTRIGVDSLDELIEKTIPAGIRVKGELPLNPGTDEQAYLNRLRTIASRNKLFKTYIGMGYYGTVMPAVIQRNILENPGWYTSYTPYQAEISQGRLEALLNFQTVVLELTGMEIANASLLDEGTAAAEAMIMLYNARSKEMIGEGANRFFVDQDIYPQTLEVIRTRAGFLGIEVLTGNCEEIKAFSQVFGVMVQYPGGGGRITDYHNLVQVLHSQGIPVAVAADIMSLVLLVPPGQWGADVVVGSTQRFGVPMNFGGPHAAYFAVREIYKRYMPGRIIGVTVDREGGKALRMALQTREQHIKRERATSNICTAQALLASMAGMYAVYHGPDGLKRIASRINQYANALRDKIIELGFDEINTDFFDTLRIRIPSSLSVEKIKAFALGKGINFRYFADQTIGISMDETIGLDDLNNIIEVFEASAGKKGGRITQENLEPLQIQKKFLRDDKYMSLELFRRYRCETEMMRYIKLLERKDFSLVHGMIPLGSCTMKLNAAAEMLPLSWPELGNLHPFVPADQAEGYHQIFHELGEILKSVTGLADVSFQPNSGAAGEYTGLLVIRKYLESRNERHRDVVLIPASAHGTNPASAAMAGLKVVVVNCDEKGNIEMSDLKAKAEIHKDNLAAFMVTYPSTHGVFESAIQEMSSLIHQHGGQVYMDGANMNAQVGLTNPAMIGADVCHLNLHKTFAIPHGGGGPGAGPILVAGHLSRFLPTHPVVKTGNGEGSYTVASAPWGSAGILVISHAYCSLLGKEGLSYATKIAILNANYLAACLKDNYKVLYTGENGFVGHEMILDCRNFKSFSEITETDIAKRLMDYGFHAPTLSFPVHGTLMVEPTESESLFELNRFADALISIYREIEEVKSNGNKQDNVLKNAPHTQLMIASETWNHPYTRKQAAFPNKWCERNKFWPTVSRVDDAFGDRNLVCTCAPIDMYR